MWVATAGAAAPAAASRGALPESVCGRLLSAGGPVDLLVVADLPLQGGLAFSAQRMEQAIAFTLRERDFRAEDNQARALARVAADIGAREVAVLDDGDPPYGELLAGAFAAEARRGGQGVAVRGTFDPQARDYRALADRVARAEPDAVFVGGLLDASGARVVRALRARLGAEVALLLPDGFTPTRPSASRPAPPRKVPTSRSTASSSRRSGPLPPASSGASGPRSPACRSSRAPSTPPRPPR